jgi:hypothetical protein
MTKERREALEMLYGMTIWMPDSWRRISQRHGPSKRYEKPGSVILNMSPERRKVLQALKSEDLRNIRPDLIFV